MGLRHAFHMVQAECLKIRWHPPVYGDFLARTHHRQRRPAGAVHACDRRGAHHPRGHRHFRSRIRGRDQAGPHRRHELRLHFRQSQRQGALAPHDPVLRDDGAVGALSRRLAFEHQGQPRALGGFRPRQSRPSQQPGARTLRPEHGLQPVPEHRRPAPGQVARIEEDVHCRGRKISGFPHGRLGGGPCHRTAAEHYRRPQSVRLHPAHDRSAPGRLSAAAQHVLHRHRGHRGAQGRRRGYDPDLGRALCRLRFLPARGQAGLPLEPARPGTYQMAERRRAGTGPAHHRIRIRL